MKNFTLTVIDTTGIQDYIFGSNLLKHNVGASALVHWATNDWVCEKLNVMGETNVSKKCEFNENTIDGFGLTSELIYAGGGNTVILFKSRDIAEKFTRDLTRKVLLEAPGLQLVIAHTDVDWDKDKFPKKLQDTIAKVNEKKTNRVHSSHVLGLGVTSDCQFTGLPAIGRDKDGRRISPEVKAKLDAFNQAHKRLIDLLQLKGYDIPKEFDYLGRTKGESSYIAIVHTDGNGLGKRIKKIAEYHPENRDYINAIREFSESVKEAANNALISSVNKIIESIWERKVDGIQREFVGGVVEIKRDTDGNRVLPIRPIVFGGDDATFICDGRLGLTLAEFYLRHLTSKNLADGKPLFARAGVAVVKSHYPFARAYALAEELAASSKMFIREKHPESNLSAFDWHFAVSGLVLGLDEIRKRDYHTRQGDLAMRPLIMGNNIGPEWRTWDTFTNIINEFKGTMTNGHEARMSEELWSRNKLKTLRTVLREGPESVKQFLSGNKPDRLPTIQGNPDSAKRGWIGNNCTCFDAIEALDFYVQLNGGV
jgi:hypothetical protein